MGLFVMKMEGSQWDITRPLERGGKGEGNGGIAPTLVINDHISPRYSQSLRLVFLLHTDTTKSKWNTLGMHRSANDDSTSSEVGNGSPIHSSLSRFSKCCKWPFSYLSLSCGAISPLPPPRLKLLMMMAPIIFSTLREF